MDTPDSEQMVTSLTEVTPRRTAVRALTRAGLALVSMLGLGLSQATAAHPRLSTISAASGPRPPPPRTGLNQRPPSLRLPRRRPRRSL